MSDEGKRKSSAAADPTHLDDKILAFLPRLSKKQREIARFFLDNPSVVAFSSAVEVGTRTKSSAATVVRFCQALGYEGYAELQTVIQQRMGHRLTMVQRLEERLADLIPRDDLLARVLATDIRNIERLAESTASDRLGTAVAKVRGARQVLVVGGGMTASAVEYFTHSLQVIGIQAQGLTCGGEPLALALAFLCPEDVAIGISFWRNLQSVVQAIHEAQEVGATTIGITDSKLSPLAHKPDFSFLVATEGTAHSLSLVATMSLLNVFTAALSADIPKQVAESLRMVDRAYVRHGLLAE